MTETKRLAVTVQHSMSLGVLLLVLGIAALGVLPSANAWSSIATAPRLRVHSWQYQHHHELTRRGLGQTHLYADRPQRTRLGMIGDSSSSSSSSWKLPSNWRFTGLQRSSKSVLHDGAIMPEGGLNPCIIKVVGVGGGGCNAVDRMVSSGVGGVDFWSINTDAQALGKSKARGAKVLKIGADATRGLGAGGDPNVGRVAAEESKREIAAMVAGTDLCFVTSGMGGGTGSGAAPIVADVAKEAGCLTVAIVTKPFRFEGVRRMKQATNAIANLRQHVDTIIVVSNDRLLEIIPENTPVQDAFLVADDILRQGVVGISDIITKQGLVNVDFADVRSVMNNAGTALMGIGLGTGKTAARDAAQAAISSPLLDCSIDNAKGVVFNVSGGQGLTLTDVNEAAKLIYSLIDDDANVIFGALQDDTMGDSISITVLATGFEAFPDDSPRTVQSARPTVTLQQQQQQQQHNGHQQQQQRHNGQQQYQQQQRQPVDAGSSRGLSNGRSARTPANKRGAASAPAPPAEDMYSAADNNNGTDDNVIPDFLKQLKKK